MAYCSSRASERCFSKSITDNIARVGLLYSMHSPDGNAVTAAIEKSASAFVEADATVGILSGHVTYADHCMA